MARESEPIPVQSDAPSCAGQARDRHWACVLRVLSELPVRQLRAMLLLLQDVGLQQGPDGDPKNILTRPQDWPLLDLPARLLAEWAENDPQRSSTDEALFLASALSFLAQAAAVSVSGATSALRCEDVDLVIALRKRAEDAWEVLFETASPFWQHYRTVLAAPGSLSGLPLIAVALHCNRGAAVPGLTRFAEACERVLSALDELARLGCDLNNGRSNSLVSCVRRFGGRSHERVALPAAVGTLLLSGKLAQWLDEQRCSIVAARGEALALASAALTAYCDELLVFVAQVGRHLGCIDRTGPPLPEGRALGTFFKPATDLLAHTIASAEACLLADPSFREAWDCCRRPGHGLDTVRARAFPISLVADILIRYGKPMRDVVDEILATLENSGYRYYEDRTDAIAPDADDLALALRLVPFASDPAHHRRGLQQPLRWMREHQRADGQIPVWFRRHDAPPPLAAGVILYGSNCAAVESNLLLSLIEFDWDGFAPLIIASASQWCRRWRSIGLAAAEHYTPLYSLWAALELIRTLRDQPIPDALQLALEEVEQLVCQRLRHEAAENVLSPQDAAFMTLASLRCKAIPLDQRWISTMIKAQRPDGAWEGEGIYIVPNGRGLVTDWFKSRTITTAFIYHALCQYRARREQE